MTSLLQSRPRPVCFVPPGMAMPPLNHAAYGRLRSSLFRGLVAFWPLDEPSGGCFDAWGVANSSSVLGAPSNRPGMHGQTARELRRTTVDAFVVTSTPVIVRPPASFTAACWVNFDTVGNEMHMVRKGLWTGSTGEWAIERDASGNLNKFSLFVSSDGGLGTVAGVSSPAYSGSDTGIWYCLIGWYDATKQEIAISVNGADTLASYTSAVFAGTGTLTIGAASNSTMAVDGAMQHVALWSRVLNPYERRLFYNNGYGLPWPWR